MTPAELAKIFPLGPDSLPQTGVPEGRVEKYSFNTSRIYPGTVRDYWVYVPAQYRPTKAACVLVVQDGHDHLFGGRWNLAVVLDNLIHQKAMPVTIGVFINPGKIPAVKVGGAERDNRSFEYDTQGDRYARFVLEEILPEVEQSYRLRPDGNSRAIFGGSSGGMCALNAAWSRPDAFQRVVSEVGSFTPMRGGHTLAAQVRLTAPKPLKVFLQGGAQDLDVTNGNWWNANLEMRSALQFAGYDVQHVWDERAGHNEFHCNMVAPDALRWVWSEYPKKPAVRKPQKQPAARIFAPQKTWQPVVAAGEAVGALATDKAGRLYFVDTKMRTLCGLEAADRVKVIAREVGDVAAFAVDDNGGVYLALPKQKRVLRIELKNEVRVYCEGITANDICPAGQGRCYLAEPTRDRVSLIEADGHARVVTRMVKAPQQVRLTPDGGQLMIASGAGGEVWQASIVADGGLANLEPYHFQSRDVCPLPERANALAVARPGWVITALAPGLHINNQNGLPAGFLPTEFGNPVSEMALAGLRGDHLHVVANGRLHRRRIKLLPTLWL